MKELLVVVDYQKDFVDGTLGFDGAEKLDERICKKISEYRARSAVIAFTYDTHTPDYLGTQEGKHLPVVHCVEGSDGWQLYGKVAAEKREGDPCFYKPSFGSLKLADYARQEGFERVELCGLVSNICVLSNAVILKAALPEAAVVVDAACTSSFDLPLHEKALDVLAGVQVEVIGR